MPLKKKTKPPAKTSRKPARVMETAVRPYGSAAHETQIPASEFKAKCLELMDIVHDTHESIVITKHGVPIAKLVPLEEENRSIVGYMRGTVLSYGDLISPIDVEWDATKDE